MKRLAIKLVLFLLLGAIVNVAVAFALCFLTPTGWRVGYVFTPPGPVTATPLPVSYATDAEMVNWKVAEYRAFGCLEIFSCTDVVHDKLVPMAFPFGSPFGTANFADLKHSTIPEWCFGHQNSTSAMIQHPFVTSQESARGWPMLALKHQIQLDLTKPLGTTPSEGILTIIGTRPVPGRPIWPGFAINTLVYAAVLWIVFAAPGFVRRRIRRFRGRCLHCGYDLRGQPPGSKTCPECGRTA